MTFSELASFDTDSIKRADEALKIEFTELNTSLKTPFNTIGEMLVNQLVASINDMVTRHFNQRRIERINAVLPAATDQQILDVAAALGIDLTVDVPK